ncbi:hypothetical protein F2Q69_00040750 [Brassica cretica]|uniref:Uncharacterized protein n=1 Tax=Brassica cretica TaxID=69181 RepID=A0A8S9NMD0_BRACR|nr:hypothetical protein F2Q69_00040750 [Brassica cretica]
MQPAIGRKSQVADCYLTDFAGVHRYGEVDVSGSLKVLTLTVCGSREHIYRFRSTWLVLSDPGRRCLLPPPLNLLAFIEWLAAFETLAENLIVLFPFGGFS